MIELPEPLPWHALNYRTAHTVDAEAMWQELAEAIREYGNACARAAMERAAQIADAERAEFMPQAANNNGSRESDFAFGSVNSAERIAAAIRAEIEKDPK